MTDRAIFNACHAIAKGAVTITPRKPHATVSGLQGTNASSQGVRLAVSLGYAEYLNRKAPVVLTAKGAALIAA